MEQPTLEREQEIASIITQLSLILEAEGNDQLNQYSSIRPALDGIKKAFIRLGELNLYPNAEQGEVLGKTVVLRMKLENLVTPLEDQILSRIKWVPESFKAIESDLENGSGEQIRICLDWINETLEGLKQNLAQYSELSGENYTMSAGDMIYMQNLQRRFHDRHMAIQLEKAKKSKGLDNPTNEANE